MMMYNIEAVSPIEMKATRSFWVVWNNFAKNSGADMTKCLYTHYAAWGVKASKKERGDDYLASQVEDHIQWLKSEIPKEYVNEAEGNAGRETNGIVTKKRKETNKKMVK